MKDFIQSLTNKRVTPLELKVDQVGQPEEIAHVLAHTFRFGRHTFTPYSVAEHCVRGSWALPSAFAGAFLLHELSEVYLPDVPSPVKAALCLRSSLGQAGVTPEVVSWSELERSHTSTILAAWNLSSLEPLIYSPEVKAMDLAMLLTEKRDLLGPEPEPWGIEAPTLTDVQERELSARITPMAPMVAKQAWLNRFTQLFW